MRRRAAIAVAATLAGSLVIACEFGRYRRAATREQLAREQAERTRAKQEEALRTAPVWLQSAVAGSRIGLWDWDLRANTTLFISPDG